ncbi:hypothetical protein MM239_12825 [Belliella sp. DSM 111904]|uniref:Glycosyltransferase RgtA/B/C/D-like domain-containing protein n=1 Tax=Belliella filtrata TaxID=2923435 RepID=A0ABS9V1R3_9BACT|nr:hypothetical protein [Belliella filtrata]MCH7410284.1 hypothetical protein [Belliella filtrata]
MLRFFKINDPFRLLGILVLLLIYSGFYYLVLGAPITQPELIWMLVGERLADGFHMYTDVIDDTGPLSVGVYWILHEIFGRSFFVYKMLAFLIAIFQITYINTLFIQYKSFDENTYIPAAVMLVLFHLSFDMLVLSPALMGGTFLVLALGQLFAQTVLQKEGSDSVLLAGVFGGIAACFHFPLIIFLPFLVVSGIAISGFTFRQFLLSLVGYFLPLSLCALYYFWIDALPEFVFEYIFASRVVDVYPHVTILALIGIFALPLLLAVIGYFVGVWFKVITVNQQKQRQLLFVYVIFAVLSILITNRRTPYQFVIIIPSLTYFITQIFVYVTQRKALLVFTFLLFVGVPLSGYLWLGLTKQSGLLDQYQLKVEQKHQISKGKKVLVLGKDTAYYWESQPATPYLNYKLSDRILKDFDDLSDMAGVYQQFLLEKPELVIDQEGTFPALLERIPQLGDMYHVQGVGIYVLK